MAAIEQQRSRWCTQLGANSQLDWERDLIDSKGFGVDQNSFFSWRLWELWKWIQIWTLVAMYLENWLQCI